MRKEYDKKMNITFIIIMVVGVLLFAASYFLPAEEDSTSTLSFQSEPVQPVKASESTGSDSSKKKEQEPSKSANESIEAAKKKAREAIAEEKEEYKFDLHLTDSSDRTVEQLEHDLLAGLNLDESGADASKTGANKTASNSNTGNANKSKNSGKKGNNNNKKKNAPKNDRYDDLLYVDENSASKEENKTVEDVVKASAGNTNNSGNSGSNKANTGNSNKSQSSKGGKKGKKK